MMQVVFYLVIVDCLPTPPIYVQEGMALAWGDRVQMVQQTWFVIS